MRPSKRLSVACDAAFARNCATWGLVLALSGSGCLDDFLSEQQVQARIAAFQRDSDVLAGDIPAAVGDVAEVPDAAGIASDVDTSAESGARSDTDGTTNADDGFAAELGDGLIDAVETSADSVCLPSGLTLDQCNGADDDCDGKTDEDPCDDSSACTAEDTCVAGKCAGKAVGCADDGDPCTLDICAKTGPAAGACVHPTVDGNPCKDDDPCTLGDACKGGQCLGNPKACSGGSVCILASCGKVDGACKYKYQPNGTPCDDANACTSNDQCDETLGICAGKPINCDDANPCTVNACNVASGCSATGSNAPCDDGNSCTVNDLCKSSLCDAGTFIACNDNNPCTTESCDAVIGKCKVTYNSHPCDDGTACTSKDACKEGQCTGAPVECGDNNLCTNDTCEATMGCGHSASSILCDDANQCTNLDQCKDGVCKGNDQSAALCGDDNPCTKDICDPKSACSHSNSVSVCDDGNPCTVGDDCDGGQCLPGPFSKTCVCTSNADCKAKEDGNLCNGTLFCDKAALPAHCAVNPASVVACDTSADTACAKNTCDPKSGGCALASESDAKPCDADANACTSGDHCTAGKCLPGLVQVCNDANPCSDDVCGPSVGCVALPNQATCDADKNPCTVADQCTAKVCVPGKAKACDDGNPCTADACNPSTGGCVAGPQVGPCDDGDSCTLGDSCVSGTCKAGTSKTCDDGNTCTADACHSATGGCTAAAKAAPCSDGNSCTVDDICVNGGCAPGKAIVCDDKSVCTADACDTKTGACQFAATSAACNDGEACTVGDQCAAGACKSGVPTVCDDLNGCTSDKCNPADGLCLYAPNSAPCDDSNVCTQGDVCTAGVCKSGGSICACTPSDQAAKCNDNNACTSDKCLQNAGQYQCANQAMSGAPCDDNNACTTGDVCATGACKSAGSKNCDDNNACTVDACNPANGSCSHAPGGDTCDDGNKCTAFDKCNNGACAGSQISCDDGKLCTADACSPADGKCNSTGNSLPCDDGNLCTTGDTCSGGSCKPTGAKICNDGNLCTDDSCTSVTGQCANTANAASCSDGDKCTVGDVCANAACKPGNAKVCDDTNPCTTDACDGGSGNCQAAANSLACEDGNKCTLLDTCGGGACKPGTLKACADNTVCTDDSCSPLSGSCESVNNTKACDDGSKCTNNDICAAGKCTAGTAIICNDNKLCTDDLCDPATGACSYTPNAKTCDDGNACTSGDNCQSGQCVPGAFTCPCTPTNEAINCNDKLQCTEDKCVVTASGGLECQNNALSGTACSDGDICTSGDSCAAGICKPTATVKCDDGNTCTADACNPNSGCTYDAVSGGCDDGNLCTLNDLCSQGICGAGTQKDCADGNVCSNDACQASSGMCTHTANSAGCSDNNACTSGDVCANLACKAGSAKVCTDSNSCTDDSCNTVSGACEFVNDNVNSCSDSNPCTLLDLCEAGQCKGTSNKLCADNNVCTDDLGCDTGTGNCKYAFNAVACNDGSLCTTSDYCAIGACAGTAVSCSDGNVCTTDSCLAASGCQHANNTSSCSDSNKCTSGDVCSNGVCKGKTVVVCDDSNACTTEQCQANEGCIYASATGSACKTVGGDCIATQSCTAFGVCMGMPKCLSTTDACSVGACAVSVGSAMCTLSNVSSRDCNDNNPCTSDSCVAKAGTGCTWSVAPSSDGKNCGGGRVCKSGLCVPQATSN